MPASTEEIVYTTSEDGFLLEGLRIRPGGETANDRPPAAVVWIHGNAGRFYDYPYVSVGRALAGAGYAVISANTRGHDISAFVWRAAGGRPTPWESPQGMPVGAGSGWDALEEASRDLAAWVDLAGSESATGRVVLVGHSSGAQRVVLYQAERQDRRVTGLVLASADLTGFMPPGQLAEAQRMVAEGRGMEVLPAQPFAPWYRQSALSVAGRHAVLSHMLESADDAPATLARVTCPILALYGTKEPGGAQGMLQTIRARATAAAGVETRLIEGADHIYSGQEEELARTIGGWIGERAAGFPMDHMVGPETD
jgi:pimeloyl-ACP methyl ester carboxylesterase